MWDVLILTLAIINLIVVPIDVAWTPDYSQSAVYVFFDFFFDFLFLIDIFLNFRTTITINGEEIYNPSKIA